MIELMISDCIDCRAKMQQPPVESSFFSALFPFQDSGRSMNEMRSDKNRSPIHTGSATCLRKGDSEGVYEKQFPETPYFE